VDFAFAVQRIGGHRLTRPPPKSTAIGKLAAATQALKRSKPLKIMSFELSGVPLSLRIKMLSATPFGYFLDQLALERIARETQAQQYFAGDVLGPSVFYLTANGTFSLRRAPDHELFPELGPGADEEVVRELYEGQFYMPSNQRWPLASKSMGESLSANISELGHAIASFMHRRISGGRRRSR
jgi:hypothetical protein